MSVIARSTAPEWQKVYLDALSVSEAFPGTVCASESHYRTGRHPEPYRMGYCHGYHTEDEHWHTSYAQLQRCPR